MKRMMTCLTFLWLSAATLTAQWTQITNIPLPPFQINTYDIEIDGANLYVITDDNAIYKSTNNGATWTKIYQGPTDINLSLLEAAGSTICFFAWDNFTGWPLMYYSNDGGATFQQIGLALIYPTAFFVQSDKIFIADDSGLFVSNDQGATFTNTNLYPPGFHNVAIIQTPVGKILQHTDFDPNTFDLLGTYIYRSTDDVNWTPLNVTGGSNPLPAGQSGQIVYWSNLGHLNGNILIGGYSPDGTGSLYKSADLGANWYPADNTLFGYNGYVAASNGNRAYVYGDAGMYTSTDATNWAATNSPPNTYPADAAGNKFGAVGEKIWLSTNNGATWAQTAGQITTPNYDVIYDYLSAGNTKFLVTQWNGIWRGTGSNPANLSWTKVLGSDVGNGGNMGWDILKKGNTLLAGIDFIAGGQQGIYRSTNNGDTWTRTHTGAGLCLFDDGNTIYAGVDYQGVLKSTNQGQTWTPSNNGFPNNSNLLSPSEIIRAGNSLVTSFFFGGIYRSTNGGANWTQVSTQSLVYCMAKAGSTLFAGAQNGLMKSTDQGATWTHVQNDLYNNTAVTALYVQDDEALYIGTGSQGMFFSADNGETLEPVNDGADDNTYVSFIGRDGSNMLAGWNFNPGWFSAFYYINSYYGRGLWYQNAGNFQMPPVAGRSGSDPSKPALLIFPNPVRDDVLRFAVNAGPEQIAGVQLVSVDGRIIRDESGPMHSPALDVHDLPNGMYFLQISLSNGETLRRQFMVQR